MVKKSQVYSISLSVSVLLLSLLFAVQPASAHVYLTPYLRIDGKYSLPYDVPYSPLAANQIFTPQDAAPENYLVDKQISFELDQTFLPLSLSDKERAVFRWDFGDGATAEGRSVSHAYHKAGSHILTIQVSNTVDYEAPNPSKPFDSVLINVLPDMNYQLPRAVMKINGRGVNDPLVDSLSFPFDGELSFDASHSVDGTAASLSYAWDFGDDRAGSGKVASHSYDRNEARFFSVLRVTDSNGFISDTFVEVDNSQTSGGPVLPSSNQAASFLSRLVAKTLQSSETSYGLLLLILVVAFFAGSLHALTPGHGKSLMAAFLIGRGRSRAADVLVITSSITFSHTAVILALGFIFLIVNIQYPVASILPAFNKLAAILVVVLALSLLFRSYRNWAHRRDHELQHEHEHRHGAADGGSQGVVALLLAGVSGGITPCVDALALLMVLVSAGQVLLGLIVVLVFSFGLASAILIIGLILIAGKDKLNLEQKLGSVAEIYGPLAAGLFILVLGARLALS
ncbi:MAG: PKD domain-containing protein [Chloroflexi bacterium]|nr:PKD domain-containing protein [Chloroflexota bacterium]